MSPKIIILAVVAALAALGAYLYYERASEQTPVEQVEPPPAPAETPPEIRYPVPEDSAPADTAPPPLDDSDAAMLDALAGVLGESARNMLIPDILVRRIVATIDGLGQPKLAVRVRPVRPVPGEFVAEGEGETLVIGPANASRYAPYVQLIQNVDAEQLSQLYVRFYPRFQEAYQQLGYPTGYFNDRLVDVIDDMLNTPDVQDPIAIVRPKVHYEFADPDLEARSAGQKLLLRMGPENAAVIKAKLRQLREEVTKNAPQA